MRVINTDILQATKEIQRKGSTPTSWIKDDSLTDLKNLPAPEILAAEIVENLEAALEQFSAVEDKLTNTK